jgi:hypothetical protein
VREALPYSSSPWSEVKQTHLGFSLAVQHAADAIIIIFVLVCDMSYLFVAVSAGQWGERKRVRWGIRCPEVLAGESSADFLLQASVKQWDTNEPRQPETGLLLRAPKRRLLETPPKAAPLLAPVASRRLRVSPVSFRLKHHKPFRPCSFPALASLPSLHWPHLGLRPSPWRIPLLHPGPKCSSHMLSFHQTQPDLSTCPLLKRPTALVLAPARPVPLCST